MLLITNFLQASHSLELARIPIRADREGWRRFRGRFRRIISDRTSPKPPNRMAKAFGGALSLLLTLVVLKLLLPEAAALLAEIIMKSLVLVDNGLDAIASSEIVL
jgi:hypothetical protein